MLGSLLDQIPAAFSRRFLLGSFLPLVLFTSLCLAIGYTCSVRIQDFASWFDARPTLVQAFIGASSTLLLAALGLALSRLSTFGRLALEAQILLPEWLVKILKLLGESSRQAANARRQHAQQALHDLREYWEKADPKLKAARLTGIATNTAPTYPDGNQVSLGIEAKPKALTDFISCVDGLEKALAAGSIGAKTVGAQKLQKDYESLFNRFREGIQALENEYREAEIDLRYRFPRDRTYPTRYARAVGLLEAYALERYGADYGVLWPRLEAVARKEEPELFGALQEVGTQLEFHVAMFWGSLLIVLIWTLVLACVGLHVWLFLAVALGGALACLAWYELGVRSYEALADQAMTAMDLLRLRVFDAMGLERPKSYAQEQKYWKELGSNLAYGAVHEVPYLDPSPEPSVPPEQHIRLSIERSTKPAHP